MSFFKSMPLKMISEAAEFQFRVEFFNMLNHPSFEVARWGGANFGNINSGSFGVLGAVLFVVDCRDKLVGRYPV